MDLVKRHGIQNRFSSKQFLLRLGFAISICTIVLYSYSLIDIDTHKPWNLRQFFQGVSDLKINEQKKPHLVLLWTPYFNTKDWLPSTKDLHCPIQNCNITSDRQLYNQSSAVIFHWRDININDLPTCPSSDCSVTDYCPLWVLFNKEAPPHTPSHILKKINDKIHWTVTYRRDSDIVASYGKVVARENIVNMTHINLNRSSVCWLVSNCHTPSYREEYVTELRNYIPVEIYGRCGNRSCVYKDTLECYKLLSNDCKFYLSFENSICKDYSTEKLYNAMRTNMVPIVFGGDDYAKHLPQNSFIDVNDFETPKDLAEYLQELLGDDSRYLSFFEWKRKYLVQDTAYRWFCGLCDKLNKVQLREVRPHDDVMKWWFDQSNC